MSATLQELHFFINLWPNLHSNHGPPLQCCKSFYSFVTQWPKNILLKEEKKIISKKSVQTHRFWIVDEAGGRQKWGKKRQ
jgi:hypothetical protein